MFLTPEMIRQIEAILTKGKTAEIVKLKHEVVVFEKTSEKKISAPLEFRE